MKRKQAIMPIKNLLKCDKEHKVKIPTLIFKLGKNSLQIQKVLRNILIYYERREAGDLT